MKDEGGAAFPRPMSTDEHGLPCNVEMAQDGMSLRDWFAGQALAGWLQQSEAAKSEVEYDARMAYDLADAMIAERAKERTA